MSLSSTIWDFFVVVEILNCFFEEAPRRPSLSQLPRRGPSQERLQRLASGWSGPARFGQALGQSFKHRDRQVRFFLEQPVEVIAADRYQPAGGRRAHARHMGVVLTKEGQLSEELTRPELDLSPRQLDGYRTLLDHEQAGPSLLRLDKHMPRRRFELGRRLRDTAQCIVRQAGEQGHLPEVLEALTRRRFSHGDFSYHAIPSPSMDTDEIVEILGSLSLFADLSGADLEAVSHTFEEESFSEGQRILRQGFGGTGFYVILEGEAAVVIDGQERSRLARGDFFGEISILLNEPPNADVTALTPLTCLVLPRDELTPWLMTKPMVTLRMLQAEVRRLRAAGRWRS